jgi:hypothetical protein
VADAIVTEPAVHDLTVNRLGTKPAGTVHRLVVEGADWSFDVSARPDHPDGLIPALWQTWSDAQLYFDHVLAQENADMAGIATTHPLLFNAGADFNGSELAGGCPADALVSFVQMKFAGDVVIDGHFFAAPDGASWEGLNANVALQYPDCYAAYAGHANTMEIMDWFVDPSGVVMDAIRLYYREGVEGDALTPPACAP